MKTAPWTPYEDTLAQEYLRAPKTFKEVSDLIGRSRASVISRARRKGWDYPGKKVETVCAPEKSSMQKTVSCPARVFIVNPELPLLPAASPPIAISLPKPASRRAPVRLEDARENQCRFIQGEARQKMCCGDKTMEGYSWCVRHAQIVFNSVQGAAHRVAAR